MKHVMFDVDGTLVQSMDYDPEIFPSVVEEETGYPVNRNWDQYEHVTDAGILREILITQDLVQDQQQIENNIKRKFIDKLKCYLGKKPAIEIRGASSFLHRLHSMKDISVSIATGGWYETTVLKLNSAGIGFSNIPIASSSSHYSRIEIMKVSKELSISDSTTSATYFGDASWDKVACEKLGYNFVMVGNDKLHHQWIRDFTYHQRALEYIGL